MSNRPTLPEVKAMAQSMAENLDSVRAHLVTTPLTKEVADAWTVIENFTMLALMVFEQTNPSKIRACAQAVEIQLRIAQAEQERAAIQ